MARILSVFLLLLLGSPLWAEVTDITPQVAREKALAGEIIVVDIRTPDEWRASGLADVAIPLDMTRPDFVAELRALLDKASGRPVAYICATAGRSAWLSDRLDRAGLPDVINVAEGMFGNREGPGWLQRGLPIRKYGAPPHAAVDIALVPGD